MRKAFWVLLARCAVGGVKHPARSGAGISLLHQGLRLQQRTRRLQFCKPRAVSGDSLGACGLLRRQSVLPSTGRTTARSRPDVGKKSLMRIPAVAILAAATLCATAPARAQTYDPAYPVCLHVYDPIGDIDCRYASLAQCAVSLPGHAAQCIDNPYFAKATVERSRRARRRAY
jgi:hypothetical protein